MKLQQKVYDNNVLISTKDYISGVEYQDGQIESTYRAEGRVFFTSNTIYRHEYAIKDHLGNIRLWVSDLGGNRILETPSEILQEKHYYPFGMAMEGPWMQSGGANNKYQYNEKELNEEFGLDLMDYGARWYDAAVGRWWSVNPLAEEMSAWSPFNYVFNNPLKFIDPDGRTPNEYKIKTNEDGTTTTTYISDKGENEIDYVTYEDECGSICSEEAPVQVEYTSGKGTDYTQHTNPTPGERVIHSSTPLVFKAILTLSGLKAFKYIRGVKQVSVGAKQRKNIKVKRKTFAEIVKDVINTKPKVKKLKKKKPKKTGSQEHTTNRRKSNKNKHEKGQARKKKDQANSNNQNKNK